ncbi:MAG: hypothetical protein K2Q14_06095, partial [Gammaproteobacteria bacterium]|nr:hypothetical protein [Gammaproteobacteria bacterium]
IESRSEQNDEAENEGMFASNNFVEITGDNEGIPKMSDLTQSNLLHFSPKNKRGSPPVSVLNQSSNFNPP